VEADQRAKDDGWQHLKTRRITMTEIFRNYSHMVESLQELSKSVKTVAANDESLKCATKAALLQAMDMKIKSESLGDSADKVLGEQDKTASEAIYTLMDFVALKTKNVNELLDVEILATEIMITIDMQNAGPVLSY
jgi:hypothetical protein